MDMPDNEKKILEEVDFLRDKYFTFDDPVPFCGMFLYPVPVKNYNEFLTSSSCLTLNKNDDIAGIEKTHLEYLLNKMRDEKEGPAWSFKFSKLLELSLHVSNGLRCNKCGKFVSYNEYIDRANSIHVKQNEEVARRCFDSTCDGALVETIRYTTDKKTKKPILIIDDHQVTSKDFSKMRRFIMYQNLPDYKDDSWVEKEIRDDQAERNALLAKQSGHASLERKLLCVCAKTNYTFDEIKEVSIRKFLMLFGIMQDALEYQINKSGLMSGMVSLKKGEKLDHWIYKKDTGLYGEAIDAEAFAKQIQGA